MNKNRSSEKFCTDMDVALVEALIMTRLKSLWINTLSASEGKLQNE